MMNDHHWMQRAIALAKQGEFTARPNPCVGAVIVKDDVCLGEGLHWQAGLPHAEVNALVDARSKGLDVKGATCYVTLEPCAHMGRTPPCTTALIEAGITRVVMGSGDPNPLVNGKGAALLREAHITVSECEGELKSQARALNHGFFSRMQRQKPWIRGKIGMSLDGRTAMKSGESQWITSENSRCDVQLWRARSPAIVTTAKTVIEDNARMSVRTTLPEFPQKVIFQQPLRVIIDRNLSLSSNASIFHQAGESLVVIGECVSEEKRNAFINATAELSVKLLMLPEGLNQHVDLAGLWQWFYDHNINDVFVEAGATFLGAMLQEKVIDEMLVYIAPKFLGHEGKPMMVLPGLTQLNQHIAGKFQEVIPFDPDIRLRLIL